MPRSRPVTHALISLAGFFVMSALFWAERAGKIGSTTTAWEYRFRDALTRTGRFNPPDSRLLFVGIDSSSISISDLDMSTLFADVPVGTAEHRALTLLTGGWPWSREVYALIADRLLGAGARVVVFDLLLVKPGTGDAALVEAFRRHPGKLVIGSNFVQDTIGPGQQAWTLTLPVPEVVPEPAADHAAIGYVNFWPDRDGIVRRAQYRATLEQLQANASPPNSTRGAPASLALRTAEKLGNVELASPFAQHLFRYSGPPGTFSAIPAYQLFVPRYWQRNFGALDGKVVVVGPYGNWAHDEHPTPFGQMAGPELQLNSINALLHHAFLRELPASANYLLIAAAGVAAWVLTYFVATMWLRLLAYVLTITGYLLFAKAAYDNADVVLLSIPPVICLAASGLGSFVYDYTHLTLEKLRIRRTLESYVSKDVVREVLDNPTSYLNSLGGRRTQVAVIVTDLRGFTTMAERVESTQLVAQLNEYLSLMVEDIFACRGSVDKFIGDAILAVWGHLNSSGPENDVTNAVEAAFRMKRTLAQLNAQWEVRGLSPFAMGCGLNFGEVVFGNIGSSRKMEPTVIGDTVNVTARLESLTKDYGRDLLLGEAAGDLVREIFTLQLVDRVVLKGKTKPLKIYTVVGRSGTKLDSSMAEYLNHYGEAQIKYANGHFQEAARQFDKCLEHFPTDRLANIYLHRCQTFIAQPPAETWSGVHLAEHK